MSERKKWKVEKLEGHSDGAFNMPSFVTAAQIESCLNEQAEKGYVFRSISYFGQTCVIVFEREDIPSSQSQ